MTDRDRAGSPAAFDWSNVMFHASTATSPESSRVARHSTSESAPSPEARTGSLVRPSLQEAQRPPPGLARPYRPEPEAPVQQGGWPAEPSKWSETTEYDSASIRSIAEAMPRSRNTPEKTASLTSLKWVGVTPHSVHQIGVPALP